MNIDFEKMGGLAPAIIQDADTMKVLMLGFMNKEAYEKTMETGKVTFYSRTRKTLWTKGETSGNFLELVSAKVDCDNDTLLIKVHPVGPVCHTGADTCWQEANGRCYASLEALQREIGKEMEKEGSYAAKLHEEGANRIAQTLGEDAVQTVIKGAAGTKEELIEQCGSLLYHLAALLQERGVSISEIQRLEPRD